MRHSPGSVLSARHSGITFSDAMATDRFKISQFLLSSFSLASSSLLHTLANGKKPDCLKLEPHEDQRYP